MYRFYYKIFYFKLIKYKNYYRYTPSIFVTDYNIRYLINLQRETLMTESAYDRALYHCSINSGMVPYLSPYVLKIQVSYV